MPDELRIQRSQDFDMSLGLAKLSHRNPHRSSTGGEFIVNVSVHGVDEALALILAAKKELERREQENKQLPDLIKEARIL